MANQASHIDRGILKKIFAGDTGSATAQQPVLQCLHVKALGAPQGDPERYRVVFSDLDNFIQTMLTTQKNDMIHDGKLRKGCFVRLKKYNSNIVKGKPIFVVLDLDVLEELGEAEKIGEPKPLENKDDGAPRPTTVASENFYGNKPDQKPQAQNQTLPARSSAPHSASHGHIYPIESLSPYQSKWTIKVRVTSKSDIKTWHNKNGEGKLFSVNLLDNTGEIKATMFNDQCDAFFDVFQEGNVYYITTPCRVGFAKKQFSNLNNDYELTFEQNTQVEKAEDQSGVAQMRFNFTSIGDLQSVDKDAVIDTIGILKEVGETSQITSKTTGKPYDKRELTLVDNTNYAVRLTIWGNTASNFDTPPESVIAFKGVKVSDFGGRSLSLLSSGTMSIDPDIDESHKLKGWYEAQGRNDTFETHAGMAGTGGGASGRQDTVKTIVQVKDEKIGMSEAAEYFNTKATIIYVRQENPAYAACLSEGCNKKVVEIEPGVWRCERCEKNHAKPDWRYILSVNVADHTGQMWLSCFDDVGRAIMGMPAGQLMELKENGTEKDSFQGAIAQNFSFRCRAKLDTYQDTQRVRYQVFSAAPLNFPSECTKLMNLIKLYD